MSRTTAPLVRLLLARDYDTVRRPDLSGYIDSANAIVTQVAACATRKGKTLTAVDLELVERWLAAHAYAVSDRPYDASKTSSGSNRGGEASATYSGKTGMYLEATLYGQTAMLVDSSGCLRALNSNSRAGARWLGKVTSEQIPIEQRE